MTATGEDGGKGVACTGRGTGRVRGSIGNKLSGMQDTRRVFVLQASDLSDILAVRAASCTLARIPPSPRSKSWYSEQARDSPFRPPAASTGLVLSPNLQLLTLVIVIAPDLEVAAYYPVSLSILEITQLQLNSVGEIKITALRKLSW